MLRLLALGVVVLAAACTSAPTSTVPSTTAATTATSVTTQEDLEAAASGPSREVFLSSLDAAGWETYVDAELGWAIRYPPGWAMATEATDFGYQSTLVTPSAEGGLVVSVAADAPANDQSSYDYLAGSVDAAVGAGLVYPPDDALSAWRGLDVDLDGRVDPQDIVTVDLFLTVDPQGKPIANEDPVGLVSWYAYYDPNAEPQYAFQFRTLGVDHELSRNVDDIVFSFEPPGGYPEDGSVQAATSDPYASLGDPVAVVDSALGTVSWRVAASIPPELAGDPEFPEPGYEWDDAWPGRYEAAGEATGSCFEIYEETIGYVGLGPCPDHWRPETEWDAADNGSSEIRMWHPDTAVWLWLKDVWVSLDGDDWVRAQSFPDPTAAVLAEPWSVAERNGRVVVIGATGVEADADTPWDERTAEEQGNTPGLIVSMSAEPAAWVSDNLSFGWKRVFATFDEEEMDTRLTAVVASDAGWVIFGVRSAAEPPWDAEWVAWSSLDGVSWEPMSMNSVDDDPCELDAPSPCGTIQAAMIDDTLVAYAWTSPPAERSGDPEWKLLVGSIGD
jgi:hypothetical protein